LLEECSAGRARAITVLPQDLENFLQAEKYPKTRANGCATTPKLPRRSSAPAPTQVSAIAEWGGVDEELSLGCHRKS
jgi:hypothetical protein